jgi:hypothetical protein
MNNLERIKRAEMARSFLQQGMNALINCDVFGYPESKPNDFDYSYNRMRLALDDIDRGIDKLRAEAKRDAYDLQSRN